MGVEEGTLPTETAPKEEADSLFARILNKLARMEFQHQGWFQRFADVLNNRPHDRGPDPDYVETRDHHRRVRQELGVEYHEGPRPQGGGNLANILVGIGIIVSILGSAWKISNDLSEFKGTVLQWQKDKEDQINRLQQQLDQLRAR
jgi:hypothetical protein